MVSAVVLTAAVVTLALAGFLLALAHAFCSPERARVTAARVMERAPLFGGGLVAALAGMLLVAEADAVRIQAHLPANADGFVGFLLTGYIALLVGLLSLTVATRWPLATEEPPGP